MPVVYFIASEDGLIKIGTSRNAAARLEALQQGHPYKLSIITTVDGSYELESKLHAHFSSLRKGGEWFSRSEELERFIRDMATGRYSASDYVSAVAKAEQAIAALANEEGEDQIWDVVEKTLDLFGGIEKLAASAGILSRRISNVRKWPLWLVVHILRRDEVVATYFMVHFCAALSSMPVCLPIYFKHTQELRRQLEAKYALPIGLLDDVIIDRVSENIGVEFSISDRSGNALSPEDFA